MKKRIIIFYSVVLVAAGVHLGVARSEPLILKPEPIRPNPPLAPLEALSSNDDNLMVQEPVRRERYERMIADLKAKHEDLNNLERLAVPIYTLQAPPRQDILPYRFNDVSRLLSMLRDPEWASHWLSIASTIGMAADKKGTLELIEFIKNSDAPWGYESQNSEARLKAITALSFTLIDQEIPEVIAFLEQLIDHRYVESLNFTHRASIQLVRNRTFFALLTINSDESLSILERTRKETFERKQRMEMQILSAHNVEPSHDQRVLDRDLELLDSYIQDAKMKRERN